MVFVSLVKDAQHQQQHFHKGKRKRGFNVL